MHQNLRRGLLGTLFAGGLLALGATAANADTSITGAVTVAPESATADLTASASLGLLGGPTPSNTALTGADRRRPSGRRQPRQHCEEPAPRAPATNAAALVDVNLGNAHGTAPLLRLPTPPPWSTSTSATPHRHRHHRSCHRRRRPRRRQPRQHHRHRHHRSGRRCRLVDVNLGNTTGTDTTVPAADAAALVDVNLGNTTQAPTPPFRRRRPSSTSTSATPPARHHRDTPVPAA